MCSVVGYIGKQGAKDFVLTGLSRLEYRGYDSAGFACIDQQSKKVEVIKSVGLITNLIQKLDSHMIDGLSGIGHTRWSTHGSPTEVNAHPHVDCKKEVALVHNGIIENYAEIKETLKHHLFASQTDTEVVAHLLEDLLKKHDNLHTPVLDLVHMIRGAFAIVFITERYPGTMILIRKRSPLCIGIGHEEMYVASDTLAFSDKTDRVIYLPDECFAFVERDKIELFDFTGKSLILPIQKIDAKWQLAEKGCFESYMLKEIYEQKEAIVSTLSHYQSLEHTALENLGLSGDDVHHLESVNFFACGTSWHAGLIGKYFFEKIAQIPTDVYLASESRYTKFFPKKNSLYMAISQSGETADTLEFLRMLHQNRQKTAVLTNVMSSSMVRESGGFLIMQAGPEMAVASTKAFSTQIVSLFWLAHKIALEKGLITKNNYELMQEAIMVAAEVLETSIEQYKRSIDINSAQKYAGYKNIIFLGRGIAYPFALEAALKLKEIAYIFVEAYPAGELKHGPIALIERGLPVFIFSDLDEIIYQKLLANVQEVKARGAHVVSFAFEHQYELISLSDDVFIIPNVHTLLGPLAMTGVMQYLVYAIAQHLGRPIDKPRNLAKSVTVE